MDNVEAQDGDDELALFLEMRRREKDHGFSSPAEPGPNVAGNTKTKSVVAITTNSVQRRRSANEKFLDSENNKPDYEWLLAAPETLAEIEVQENFMVKRKEHKARSTALKPRVENILQTSVRECVKVSKPIPSYNSSTAVSKQSNAAAELKPRSKSSKQITPTSGNMLASTKINSARLSTKQYPNQDTGTTSTRSNPRASALTRSSSVGKSVPGGPKSTGPIIPEIRTRPVSASRSRAYSSGVHSRSGDRSTGRSKSNNDMNPVLLGTQMVERVVNMRRLPPPKLDDNINSTGKSNGLSFGRTLSSSSLDMALRHMNIRRSVSGNLRVTIGDQTNSSDKKK